jgi:hypothetical protein
MRISVSFVDRSCVAHTAWTNLRAAEWQTVRIDFDAILPNPYYQPPGARSGTPIDVSEVKGVAFAPQDAEAGRLVIGPIGLVR